MTSRQAGRLGCPPAGPVPLPHPLEGKGRDGTWSGCQLGKDTKCQHEHCLPRSMMMVPCRVRADAWTRPLGQVACGCKQARSMQPFGPASWLPKRPGNQVLGHGQRSRLVLLPPVGPRQSTYMYPRCMPSRLLRIVRLGGSLSYSGTLRVFLAFGPCLGSFDTRPRSLRRLGEGEKRKWRGHQMHPSHCITRARAGSGSAGLPRWPLRRRLLDTALSSDGSDWTGCKPWDCSVRVAVMTTPNETSDPFF